MNGGAGAPTPPPAGRLPLRLLYVEDNRLNAMLFAEFARLHGGIELEVAETGAEALALAAQWRPDVLVLDAHLPDTDGYALLARLRELPGLGEASAFMCSADAGAQDVERARRAGFAGHWSKPIDLKRLTADLGLLAPPR